MDTNNKIRCSWSKQNDLYIKYHDNEWGVPVYDDLKLFECLLLETFQAGLSWITILKKRENFRKAFNDFNYNKISNYSSKKINDLQLDTGIIRNKLKIKAAKTNAIAFIRIQKNFGTFSKYIWKFVDGNPIQNNFLSVNELPTNTLLSDKISSDLKKRGFKFVGSTIIYSYMQAIGMVNDHITRCFRHDQINN